MEDEIRREAEAKQLAEMEEEKRQADMLRIAEEKERENDSAGFVDD